MHIYRITTKPGGAFEVHAVGKNTRMPHRHGHSHSRTPSAHGGVRPRIFRRESTASDVESVFALDTNEDAQSSTSGYGKETGPLTPATSVGSTPAFMFPPPPIEASSRRSSFSSNAPGSPSPFNHGRYGRSPSPMPPLPAIRSLPSPSTAASTALWANVKLYGDESFTNFFRRLTFSPDGGLLLTPAGQFEDPSVIPGVSKTGEETTPARGRKGHPSESASSNPTSSVYIYSRANFARPPIAQLPGHKKASVAVRFSPILYELRPGVASPVISAERPESKKGGPPSGVLERGMGGTMDVDVLGPAPITEGQQASTSSAPGGGLTTTPQRAGAHPLIVTPTPRPAFTTPNILATSPAISPVDLRPPTPVASKPSTPTHSQTHSQLQPHSQSQSHSQGSNGGTIPQTGSVFALPYRLMFAVVTMDTVAIYDTQQSTPLCLLTKLHYDEFTDLTWYVESNFLNLGYRQLCSSNRSPDGQSLILSSRDGYCTLVVFDDILPAHHTQQHTLQLQSIAQHHSVPFTFPSNSHYHQQSASTHSMPPVTPSSANVNLPFVPTAPPSQPVNTKKRSDPPLTPAASVDGSEGAYFPSSSAPVPEQTATTQGRSSLVGEASGTSGGDKIQEPPKKKRRVALVHHVGDSES